MLALEQSKRRKTMELKGLQFWGRVGGVTEWSPTTKDHYKKNNQGEKNETKKMIIALGTI